MVVKGKHKILNEVAAVVKSVRELPPTKLFHCSDDVKWQNQIGDDLMEWADKEDSRLLDSFPLSRRLAPEWFYKMAKKNPYFAQCLSYAKAKLGERMEDKIKDNPIHISKALPLYSTLWIEAEQKKQDAQNAISGPTNITVKMPNLGKERKDV